MFFKTGEFLKIILFMSTKWYTPTVNWITYHMYLPSMTVYQTHNKESFECPLVQLYAKGNCSGKSRISTSLNQDPARDQESRALALLLDSQNQQISKFLLLLFWQTLKFNTTYFHWLISVF